MIEANLEKDAKLKLSGMSLFAGQGIARKRKNHSVGPVLYTILQRFCCERIISLVGRAAANHCMAFLADNIPLIYSFFGSAISNTTHNITHESNGIPGQPYNVQTP